MRAKVLLLIVPAAVAALVIALVVFLAGGGDTAPADGAPATAAAGREVFVSAGCAGCHSLSEAGTRGIAGPDLDVSRPTREQVVRQVRDGGRGMPAFAGRISAAQVEEVADYVAWATTATTAAPVTGPFTPDDTTVAECGQDLRCMEQAYGNVSFRRGPGQALDELGARMRSDPAVNAGCHRIAHAVGSGALRRFEGQVARALAAGSALCWSGFYHGVLERAFAGVADDQMGAVARDLCADPGLRRDTFVLYQCVHGLGHGLMIRSGLDLPLALRACNGLQTDWDRSSCTGGVFMENLSSSYGTRSRWLREDDPLYPCTAVARRDKPYCYLMVTSRILPMVGGDYARAGAWCRRSDRGFAATCFQSLGRDASGNTQQDARRIRAACATAREMEGECLYGAARDIVSNDAGPRRAVVLCNGVGGRWQLRCDEGTGTILGVLHPPADERRRACRALGLDAPRTRACLKGAGVPA